MKIKIVEKGWERFTGFLGQVNFENGISVEDVGNGQARALAAILRVESVEDGSNPSISQRMVDNHTTSKDVPAPNVTLPAAGIVKAANREDAEKDQTAVFKNVELGPLDRETLEKIADQEGIKGLRDIGDKIGVTSKSIEGLIDGISKVRAVALGAEGPEVLNQ